MCYERYIRRDRQEETEQSRKIWSEFDKTTPISDPAPPEVTEPDAPEPERAEETTVS